MAHLGAGRGERMMLAGLVGLTLLAALAFIWQLVMPQVVIVGPLTIDRLGALMALLVSGIGTVTYRFALRYLAGEPGQRRFLRWLAATVVAALLLMLTTHLLALFAAWFFVSIGLHRLLLFYSERREAQRPARKKFLISRLGDLALLGAIGVIWVGWGTFDLHVFLARLASDPQPALARAAALLLVGAALTKAAQFPFHSWLPETMEAPTPVSALMHAGIINAGGVLLLRFAPLLNTQAQALLLLTLFGTITMAFGTLVMWMQPDIKRTLAWSTVSQMGFMMVQIGLAAFPAAALHIVGHGCYKAWSFLRSGDLPPARAVQPAIAPRRALALGALGSACAVPALWLAAQISGFDPLHSPGELALAAIVALAIGQLWVALLGRNTSATYLLATLLLTGATALLAFGLYQSAALYLAPVIGTLPVARGPLAWLAALLPVLATVVLIILHAYLPTLVQIARGRAFRIHALNGFYIGTLANRLVDVVWQQKPQSRSVPAISSAFAPARGEHD